MYLPVPTFYITIRVLLYKRAIGMGIGEVGTEGTGGYRHFLRIRRWALRTILVAVNEDGLRIGESHPRAKLSDDDVELIRSLAEDGMCYRVIAQKFEISRVTVGRICRYERRGQTVARFKNVILDGD